MAEKRRGEDEQRALRSRESVGTPVSQREVTKSVERQLAEHRERAEQERLEQVSAAWVRVRIRFGLSSTSACRLAEQPPQTYRVTSSPPHHTTPLDHHLCHH